MTSKPLAVHSKLMSEGISANQPSAQAVVERLRMSGAKGGKAGRGASKRRSAAFYKRLSALGIAARVRKQLEAK